MHGKLLNSDIENKAIKWRPADWNRIGNDAVDAVAKLVRFRIPLMIAKGVPTLMALTIAEESGVTLAGRARGGVLRVYTCPDRISA